MSYFPITNDQFIWTHNRDEDPRRSVPGLSQDGSLYYPKDKRAGGTWIAISKDRIISLLNGAYQAHPYQLSRVKSRGIVVLECMNISVDDIFTTYDLSGIEPFTMVIWDKGELYDLRWDKKKKYIHKLDPTKAQIWSSVTLYDATQRESRKQLFTSFFSGKTVDKDLVNQFHRLDKKHSNTMEPIRINREYVRTVSISQVVKCKSSFLIEHDDLLSGKKDRITF